MQEVFIKILVTVVTSVILIENPAQANYVRCLTSRGESGRCIPKAECLFPDSKPQPLKDGGEQCKDYGLNPTVCCRVEKCTDPDGFEGSCVKIEDCPKVMKILSERTGDKKLGRDKIDFLKRSQCTQTTKLTTCCRNDDMFPLMPSNERCGRALTPIVNMRIFGGQEASLTDYPWMAVLVSETRDGQIVTNCAGSLINKRHIITAAHCVVNDRKLLHVRLGDHNLLTEKDCEKVNFVEECADTPENITILEVHAHPGYNEDTMRNDIALLKLAQEPPMTFYISPACLPPWDPEPMNQELSSNRFPLMLQAAGWGATMEASSSATKMHVSLPMVNRSECQRLMREEGMFQELWHTQICAGGQIGEDTCAGDSGGPLMLSVENSWHLIGIVSYGPQECGTSSPGVYTNIYPYIKWINSVISPKGGLNRRKKRGKQ